VGQETLGHLAQLTLELVAVVELHLMLLVLVGLALLF